MSSILDLNGRIAMVSGAGQGVGRQIALHLASHNAGGVIVNDYYLERAASVVEEIEKAGGKAIAVQGDVTAYESMEHAVKIAEEHFGQSIGILVNNAGNSGVNSNSTREAVPFWESDPESWDAWISVNLYGVLNCCRAVLPGMIKQGEGGRIITIISEAGRVGEPYLPAYSAAKAGASGLMRSLARELGRHGITANSVSISATRTPTVEGEFQDEERLKKILKSYVIRRVGEPSDIANMVLFLASNASGWITGQTYPVNGGYSFNV